MELNNTVKFSLISIALVMLAFSSVYTYMLHMAWGYVMVLVVLTNIFGWE